MSKRGRRILAFAIEHGLVSTNDNAEVWCQTYTPITLDRIVVTAWKGRKIIHDSYDSVIKRDGRFMVTGITENTDEFIHEGRGVIENDW